MKHITFAVILIISQVLFAQTNTFRALVLDENYSPLAGAIVRVLSTDKGCVANEKGECIISQIPNGVYEFKASYVGHDDEKIEVKFPLLKDSIFVFVLTAKAIEEKEIVATRRHRETEYINLEKNNWEVLLFDSAFSLKQVLFTDENNGWLVGGKGIPRANEIIDNSVNGIIMHTSNGGKNWDTQFSENTGVILSVYFVNETTGFAVSYMKFFKTTNSGTNWIAKEVRSESGGVYGFKYKELFFISDNEGYLSGFNFTLSHDTPVIHNYLLSTTNGGDSWSSKSVEITEYDKYFPDKNIVFKDNFGYELRNNLLRVTIDHGKTWDALYPPAISSVLFIDDKVGYAVSAGGMYLLKTVTGGR